MGAVVVGICLIGVTLFQEIRHRRTVANILSTPLTRTEDSPEPQFIAPDAQAARDKEEPPTAKAREIDARVEQERADRAQEMRQEILKQIREVFSPSDQPIVSEEETNAPWSYAIKHQRPPLFTEICKDLDRFESLAWAVGLMKNNAYPHNISWGEVSMEENGAHATLMLRETGIRVIENFIKIFEVPRPIRKMVEGCFKGKGNWDFGNELEEFYQLAHVLDVLKPNPSELSVTPQELRYILLREINAHSMEVQIAATSGLISEDDAANCLLWLKERAREE